MNEPPKLMSMLPRFETKDPDWDIPSGDPACWLPDALLHDFRVMGWIAVAALSGLLAVVLLVAIVTSPRKDPTSRYKTVKAIHEWKQKGRTER